MPSSNTRSATLLPRASRLPSSTAPIVLMGQKAPAKIAVRPSIEKAADTQASASATMNAATLTGVMDRRVTAVCGMTLRVPATVGVTSVTVGVTALMSVMASALRRISPAFSHAFSRRPVRILFQPHWRASSAALAVTHPSGWERSQASASTSSNGRLGTMSVMMRCCSSTIGRHDLMEVFGRPLRQQ